MAPPVIIQQSIERISKAKSWTVRNHNILFFVGGFLFDALTLWRIDAVLDLSIQLGYLATVALIIIYQVKEEQGRWTPSPRINKLWQYNVEALHFVYGGLLSAYVIFYFKSSTFSRSAFFLVLVFVLMFANEMPQLRRAGSRMRLGLFALCIVSYLNYLLPVLIGRMGGWVFSLAVVLSVAACVALVKYLAEMDPNPKKAYWVLGWPPAVVMALIVTFYVNRWIPPVPLSMQYAGIYHGIEKANGDYQLTQLKWPWYQFWRSDDRPFFARPGDVIYCFVRVFGPRRFRDEIYLHWQYQAPGTKRFVSSDRIPLSIYGGRGEGFRGFVAKSNYEPGRWRVSVETRDQRVLGEVTLEVRQDASVDERRWRTRVM